MAQVAVQPKMTPEEYLAFERASEIKHEYADGEIFAMSGGTFEHSTLAASFIRDLGAALFGGPCRVITSDMRVKIPDLPRYVYPDGGVVCGEAAFEGEARDTLENPTLLIEVLSNSSEAYDRGEKFALYRTIPSLQLYVLASQKEPKIEVFERQADGGWLLRIYGPGATVSLPKLGCVLEVDRIYSDVLEASG